MAYKCGLLPMNISFRERLLERELLLGTMITVGDQAIVEALAQVGFDWLFIETEHAPNLADRLNTIIMAAGSVPCLVRLSRNDEISIKRALDSGAAGIIAPRVNSVEMSRDIIEFAKFPPHGSRGIGISRANRYGLEMSSYVGSANNNLSVVIQIEDYKGIENLDKILSVDGVDAIFIGPYDLSASIGRTGDLENPEVRELIDRARKICANRRIPIGIFEPDNESAIKRIEEGFSLVTLSTDISCMINQAKSLLGTLSK